MPSKTEAPKSCLWLLAGVVLVISACSDIGASSPADEEPAADTSRPSTTSEATTMEADLSPSRSEIEEAMAVVDEFLGKRAAGDIDGLVAMLTEIEAYAGANPYYYETMNQVFGQVLEDLECVEPVELPALVTCTATVLHHLQQALGLDPCTTELTITVEMGAVSWFDVSDTCDSFYIEQWVPFQSWIKANYPEHEPLMYDLEDVTDHSGLVTDESTDLWFQHMDEYLTEVSNGS